MAVRVEDYLIDLKGIDWPSALKEWGWLLPEEFTLWMVNRLGDLFIVLPDGTVHMLDVGAGSLTKLAESRDDFCAKIDEDGVVDDWLAIPLVDALVEAGVRLDPGRCYGFARLPMLGGAYDVSNCAPLPIADYLGATGSMHYRMKDVPDGGQVVIEIVGRAAPPRNASCPPGRASEGSIEERKS